MEAVRQVINSELLRGVVPLPKSFRRKQVELIIFIKEETGTLPKLTMGDIDSLLPGSIVESLIGAIPQSDKTLDNYRAERLSKYEVAD